MWREIVGVLSPVIVEHNDAANVDAANTSEVLLHTSLLHTLALHTLVLRVRGGQREKFAGV